MVHLPQTRKGRIRLAAIAGAAVVLYVLYRLFAPEIDLDELLGDVSRRLGSWTYLLVGGFAFLETGAFVGLVAPGETAVVLGGAVAGQGEVDVIAIIALAWGGAFLGDSASFMIGAKLGRGWVLRHGERLRITRERFAQVEGYFDRHGGKTILIGRFIGIVRALAPFIAGSSGMRYSRMAPFSILGTGLWATFFVLLGYFASRNLDAVLHASEQGFLAFGVLVFVVVAGIVTVRYLRVEENRDRLEAAMRRRPWLRPLLRLAPQVRFIWRRLTPGELGLELTAPLAALAVGSFVFVGYAIVIGETAAATPADRAAIDIVERLRSELLTDVTKLVTRLGSTAVVIAVSLLAAIGFAWRRHWAELGILLLGVGALLIVVPELKDAFDRPRPPAALVEAGGASYPSGHAAMSVVYTWLAVAVTVRLRPRWGHGTAILVAGIVVAAIIGLSRVYLGNHFLSDVTGGWGLGVSVFALTSAGAVIVSFVRNNRQPDGEESLS